MRCSVARGMRYRRMAATALCGGAVAVVAFASMGGTAPAAPAPGIGFSHAVVVDQQRPGFEPDVKIDTNGNVYTSVPFGFSTTQSFVWSSLDGGNSYQFTPGTVGPGKPATCVGGGDTDLFLDAQNALYFSDLQGLTNITNSMSTNGGATWNTNCAGADNTPDDRMWFAGTGSAAGGDLTLYQDYDAVDTALPNGGNQLVETVSHDGTTFQPVISTGGLTSSCAGLAVNCVTNNEGISEIRLWTRVPATSTSPTPRSMATTQGRRSECRSRRARSHRALRQRRPGRRARTSTRPFVPTRVAWILPAVRRSWQVRTSPASPGTPLASCM
jgi:hypothetical protein